MNKFLQRLLLLFLAIFFLSNHCDLYAGNHKVPEVGKPCPDFTLTNLVNSKQSSISLKDFKGKWLMIDIWDLNCASCIGKFPLVSRLQQHFSSQLSVLLIGINESLYSKDIKNVYLKLQKRLNLSLLTAFDTVVSTQWGVYSVPYIVMVNPEGIVYAITNGLDMDSFKIQQLVDGKKPEFRSMERKIAFDEQKPLLINNNGGPDTAFLYRSILTRYVDEDYYTPDDVNFYFEKNKAGFQITGAKLYRLYYFAFVGKWLWGLNKDSLFETVSTKLELNVKDSSLFEDVESLKNRFNYNLYLPPGRKDAHTIMQVLQRELKNCFGYDASLETRAVPCWTLVFRKDTTVSLRSSGIGKEQTFTPTEIRLKNGTINQVIAVIAGYNQGETPFIDETGIDYPIDIDVEALWSDLPEVQRSLHKNGLELIKKKRPMKVIVIRDPVMQ